MAKSPKRRVAVVSKHQVADRALTNEYERLVSLCRQRPFFEAMRQIAAERHRMVMPAMNAQVADGLVAIAEDVAQTMEPCDVMEKVVALMGVEMGFLLGYVAAFRTGEEMVMSQLATVRTVH